MRLGQFLNIIRASIRASKKPKTVDDRGKWQCNWAIKKYHGKATPETLFAMELIPGNLLLNEGITELIDFFLGEGSPTAFNNANARIGIGDSDTAAAATQTDLQAAVNKVYIAMDATYPQRTNQTVTFRATAGTDVANFAWKEFSIDNGGVALKNLNRKVEDHGTKASGDTWVITATVTIS